MNNLRAFFPVSAALAAAQSLIHTPTPASVSATARVEHYAGANEHTPSQNTPVVSIKTDDASHSASEVTLRAPELAQDWTPKAAKRFEALSHREALGEITEPEFRELERLSSVRRRWVNPPTVEDMQRMYRRQKYDEELIALLQKYAGLAEASKDRSQG